LLVAATLNDATMVHHQNLIGIGDGRQSMGNGQRGAVFCDSL